MSSRELQRRQPIIDPCKRWVHIVALVMGLSRLLRRAIFSNDFSQNMARNGVNSVALVHGQKLIGCKSLK